MFGEQRRVKNIVLLAIVFEGSLLLLTIALAWLLGHSLSEQVKFRWQALGFALVATCPPLLVLFWCTRPRWKLFTRLFREIEDQLLLLFAHCSVLDLATISILAGVAEESLFRGILQTTIADWFGPPLALVVASILFGLAHFITPTYAFLASVIGFYLGYLLMISDNLLVPILVHALYDFVALLYFVRKCKQTDTTRLLPS